jgi:hypothetical protein
LLPIHAAGRDGAWLADLAVSSYTPTITALIDARPPPASERNAVEVAHQSPRAADRSFLWVSGLGVDRGPTGPLGPGSGTPVEVVTSLQGVIDALPHSSAVHFDCHADQDLDDPANGRIILPDGVLRLFELADLSPGGDFAALAACKTALGGKDLLDESITLAAALHYSGYRHVIGSLWSLSDAAATMMFDRVYQELDRDGELRPDRSAFALAQATSELRKQGYRIHDWAALLHIGP